MIRGIVLAFSASCAIVFAPINVYADSTVQAQVETRQTENFVHRFLEMSETGDQEGANKVMESVALILSWHIQEKGISQDEFNVLSASEIDELIEEALTGAETWTLNDLHDKARPMRELAEQEIERQALESKDTLLRRKAEIEQFNGLEQAISIGQMQRGSDIDEFGYPRWFIQSEVQNDSDSVLTHIELSLIVNSDTVGTGTVYLKAEEGIAPGGRATMKAYVDPTTLLGEAYSKARAHEIGHKVSAFYLKDKGRVFKGKWTEDMEDTLNLALDIEQRRNSKSQAEQ
ncbi:hypothetical protein [Marinobacter sp. P4B1]|uniref:hypothetical protein n=1 Tax=Marinobacter sp. P4B1 TaxID=1119533 RepID=UPI00071DFDA2|nr:hypothetical protein [Marinobacter sp. P4B1]KRW83726.1 hypothetical protein AQ621_16890 [Marinobacter sp. P4B1]